MSSREMIVYSVIEIGVIILIFWGVFHEELIVNFEKKLFSKIKTEFKKIKNWVIE